MSLGTTNTIVLTGTVVTVGRWAEGKTIDIRLVVGGTILAVGLAALSAINANLASSFGVLILVGALLRYTIPIVSKTGIAK